MRYNGSIKSRDNNRERHTMERTYKGWKIVTRDREFWIYPPDDKWASDVLPTVREAKEVIDHWTTAEKTK